MKDCFDCARDLFRETVAIRRDLHKHAELAHREYRTASFIIHRLRELGYDVRYGRDVTVKERIPYLPSADDQAACMKRAIEEGADASLVENMADGMTGVVGTLDFGKEGRTVAFRFDMDANAVDECRDDSHRPARLGFSSVHGGAMHACAHDGHVAIGLTLARLLSENKDRFSGRVKLIFQPAEEGVRGGIAMAASGIVDDVDYFFGGHVGFAADKCGMLAASVGGFLASSHFDVIFKGKSSHAGKSPEEGRNALLAAAQATLAMHAIPRHSGGASRINVGEFHAGSARNVIPETAKLIVQVRGITTEVNAYMKRECERIIRAAADMYSVEVKIEDKAYAVSCDVDGELAREVAQIARDCGHFDNVVDCMDFGASEDCTAFIQRVLDRGGHAVYMLYGSDLAAEHHNGRFDFCEDTLPYAVGLLATLAERYTKSHA